MIGAGRRSVRLIGAGGRTLAKSRISYLWNAVFAGDQDQPQLLVRYYFNK